MNDNDATVFVYTYLQNEEIKMKHYICNS